MAAVIRRHRWLALVCVAMMLGAGVFLAMRLLARPQSVQAQVAESTVSTSQPASDQPFHWQRDIDPNLNANVRSEVEALKTGRYPERLSALVSARPFDRAAFKANPQAYLDVVEPGRVFQPAQPGPQVKAIRPTGEPFVQVAPDSSVALKVTAEAGAPVTFTSFDLGAFENQMTSITVLADEQGEAQATFTATAWTVGEVNILAASPLTSERVHFYVCDAQAPDDAVSGAKRGRRFFPKDKRLMRGSSVKEKPCSRSRRWADRRQWGRCREATGLGGAGWRP